MPERHVITVHGDGAMEFTRNRTLMDAFGHHGTMERVTEISKVPDEPLYYIKWLMGPFAATGHPADVRTGHHTLQTEWAIFKDRKVPDNASIDAETGVLRFPSYEEAVAHEVECLNRMREFGVSFARP